MANTLIGANLAGTSTTRNRIENDYYATAYESTKALMDVEQFNGNSYLEPCVGGGHIAEMIKEYYPNAQIYGYDLVDRGYKDTKVCNFLTYDFNGQTFDNVITNPPYSLAQEFLEKSMSVVKNNGKVAMFLKIQFLEGAKRRKMFEKFPPKYIYVFSKRQNPWRNGSPTDEKGKPWASTMCFAWFVWEKGFYGDPIIKWI